MKTSTTGMSNKFKLGMLSVILGLSVLSTACSDSNSNAQSDKTAQAEKKESTESKDKDKEKEKPPVPVEVVTVKRGDIQQTYRTITTLEPEQDAQIVARSTGLLNSIFVEEGDWVKKGQLLAQLDVEQLSLEVAQLNATTKKLAKELQRQQTLFNRKLGSSDALDRAKFEYQAQQAQNKLAKLKLQYASIKAPIDGIVTERLVKKGNLIRENDLLFKIIDPRTLKAILHLPEKELNNVKKGQNVLLNVDALGDQVIVGKIERIRPLIDSNTGTFRVVAQLENNQNLLKAGMFGKVEVVFDTHKSVVLLEQQALITQDNRSHVFVVKDNKAIQTPVEIDFKNNGFVEITNGLSESDQVVTTGQQILKHEALIEIVNNDLSEEKENNTSTNQSIANN